MRHMGRSKKPIRRFAKGSQNPISSELRSLMCRGRLKMEEEYLESDEEAEEEEEESVPQPEPTELPEKDGGGTFRNLLDRLFQQMCHTTSKKLLSQRNETAFLICLLNKRVPALKNCFGAYAAEICNVVYHNIMNQTDDIEIPCIIDSTKDDAEFLKYLIWITQFIVNCGDSKKIINEYDLVSVFMRILVGPSRLLEEIRAISNVDQLEALALESLCLIAKNQPLLFLQSGGLPEIVSYIRNFGDMDGIPDGSKRCLSTMTHILRTILTTVESTSGHPGSVNRSIVEYLRIQNLQSIVINVITKLTIVNFVEEDEPIICNLLFSSSIVTRNFDTENDAFDNYTGVKVITRLIRQLLYHPAHERHMNPLIHIAVAECVLRCIADNPSSMEAFLGHEGLLRLLDLLELSASPPATLHILNCLLGLCEYPRCMDQLLYWKRPLRNRTQRLAYGDGFNLPQSKGPGANKPKPGEGIGDVVTDYDDTLSALLCDIWRDEEKRLGVLRDDEGCIACINNPLKSKFAREYEVKGLTPSDYAGPSSLDMTGSVRPKIYLLVNKITKTVNTEAQLFDGLSLKNQVTMQTIINFLDLKRSEVWNEINAELEAVEFPFLPSDRKTMELLLKVAENKVTAVIETQLYLIQRETEKNEIHEREFYKLLKKCQLQGHIKAVREADYLAKTTDYRYLVEKRLWQKSQLHRATIRPPPNFRLHRTTDGPLNVTVWPGRTKIIVADPAGFEDDEEESSTLEVQGSDDMSSKGEERGSITVRDASILLSAATSIDDIRMQNVSMRTAIEENGTTPKSEEENFYQVPPEVLTKALQQVLAEEKKRDWLAAVDEENYWKVRLKWKKDWYPEEALKLNVLHANHQ